MIITLYNIQELQYNKNNTIKFMSETDRKDFFIDLPIQQTVIAKLSPNWIKNIWRLDNEITIFNEGRYPYTEYNYIRISEDEDSKQYYFYIVDYEEIGNNQIKYILKKDTLMTYVTTPNQGIDIESKTALILREHKDRFWSDGQAKWNKEIEPLNIVPSVVVQESVKTGNETILVLKAYGGNTIGTKTLSYQKYAWEVFTKDPVQFRQNKIIATSSIPIGWGVRKKSNPVIFYFYSFEGKLIELVFDVPSGMVVKHVKAYIELWDGNTQMEFKSTYVTASTANGDGWHMAGATNPHIKIDNESPLFFKAKDNNDYEILSDLGIEIATFGDRGRVYAANSSPHSVWSKTLDQVDYSSAENQKIIKLPYTPLNSGVGNILINTNGNKVIIESLTDLDFGTFDFNMFTKTFDTSKVFKNKVPLNDPKIYTSQFQPYFLTWFNESMLLKRENIPQDFTIFKTKLNNSDYTKVLLYNDVVNNQNKPYELSKLIDMNNVVANISSDLDKYLTYQAENDLKLIQIQNSKANKNIAQQAVSVGVSTATGAIGGMITGNPLGAAVGATAGLVRGVTNLGFAISNANDSKKEREIQYENKMNSLQSNLINISGGSYELSEAVGSNRMKLFSIRPTDVELAYLDEYFHKYGYQTLELKKPVLKTRRLWDYKEMIIDEIETFAPVTEEVKEDIKRRFKEGVTIYHYYDDPVTGDPTVYFKQDKENWEL